MSNDRCSICNSVSSSEIQSNPEDRVFGSHPMKVDPSDNTRLLCFECQGELSAIRSEWADFEFREEVLDEYNEEINDLLKEIP